MLIEKAAGVLLFDRQLAHSLLIQDLKGTWRFPSGRNLEGEPFREAAIRELWEETGIAEAQFDIQAPPIPLVSSRLCPRRGQFTKLTYLYPALLILDGLPALRPDSGEVRDAKFVPVAALEELTNSKGRFATLILAYSALQASIAGGFATIDPA
jgi:8-oxo-dGTP pyrophosphatase MutT (NUDIX family)